MKMKTNQIYFGLVVVGTLGVAASSFAESRQSFAAEQKLLSQALSDMRAAKAKLNHAGREFDGHKSRSEQSLEQAITEVESAIEYARNNPELPPKHDHGRDR